MMKRRLAAGTAALAVALAGPAAAQSLHGDTRLTYQDGVVYDDDLVPGRGVNQPYLAAEQAPAPGAGRSIGAERAVPSNSPNLIGSDGRVIDAVRVDAERAERRNQLFIRR